MQFYADSPQAASYLQGEPLRQFQCEFESLQQDFELQVGEVRAGTTILLAFKLVNQMNTPITFDKISASCGCIGGLPRNLKLGPGENVPVRAAMKIPRQNEKLSKVVTLADSESSVSVRLLLGVVAKLPIQLQEDTFIALEPGRHSFETRIEFPFHNPEDLKVRLGHLDFAGCRMIPTGVHSGKLVFDYVRRDTVSSDVRDRVLVYDRSNHLLDSMAFTVICDGRPTSIPSRLLLRRAEDRKTLKGRVLLRFPGLVGPNTKSDRTLEGTIKRQNGETSTFDIQATLHGSEDMKSVAILSIDPASLQETNGNDSFFVTFSVDDRVLKIPMLIAE